MRRQKVKADRSFSRFMPGVTAFLLLAVVCDAWPAPLSDGNRSVTLPSSIYMSLTDGPDVDKDLDGLIDDYENRLADTWRPYFVFDQNENSREQCHDVVKGVETVLDTACVVAGCAAAAGVGCGFSWVREKIENGCRFTRNIVEPVCKGNVKDDSLQPFEPVVLFQVRLKDGPDWPRRIRIQYAFLYRLDGGFRTSNVCTNYHYGDTQSGSYELVSDDGNEWKIESLNLWSGGQRAADSPAIEWTEPRDTYWGKMPKRPSPVIYASAGKHHQYVSAKACEEEPGTCDDDCGGGAHRLANLTPNGLFNNVGEYQEHPADKGANNPFVNDLAPLGYADEFVWWAKWRCSCEQVAYADKKDECFTGGTGGHWSASTTQKCDIPTPVYKLFDRSAPRVPPKGLGMLLPVIASL